MEGRVYEEENKLFGRCDIAADACYIRSDLLVLNE